MRTWSNCRLFTRFKTKGGGTDRFWHGETGLLRHLAGLFENFRVAEVSFRSIPDMLLLPIVVLIHSWNFSRWYRVFLVGLANDRSNMSIIGL